MSVRSKAVSRAKNEIFKRKCAAEEQSFGVATRVFGEHEDIAVLNRQKDEFNKALFLAMVSDDASQIGKIKNQISEVKEKLSEKLRFYYGDENILTPKYCCSECNDTGYRSGEECECLKKLVNKYISGSFNMSEVYSVCRFSSFDLSYYGDNERKHMQGIFEYCKNYTAAFSAKSNSILMIGKTGLGKTHLSMSIARELAQRGVYVIYSTAQSLLKKIEDEHFGRSEGNTLDELYQCELLVLDDLGTEFQSQFNSSAVYDIINTRLLECRPTIINTNLEFEEMVRRYSDRIVSRIAYHYDMLNFIGSDIRIARKKAEQ